MCCSVGAVCWTLLGSSDFCSLIAGGMGLYERICTCLAGLSCGSWIVGLSIEDVGSWIDGGCRLASLVASWACCSCGTDCYRLPLGRAGVRNHYSIWNSQCYFALPSAEQTPQESMFLEFIRSAEHFLLHSRCSQAMLLLSVQLWAFRDKFAGCYSNILRKLLPCSLWPLLFARPSWKLPWCFHHSNGDNHSLNSEISLRGEVCLHVWPSWLFSWCVRNWLPLSLWAVSYRAATAELELHILTGFLTLCLCLYLESVRQSLLCCSSIEIGWNCFAFYRLADSAIDINWGITNLRKVGLVGWVRLFMLVVSGTSGLIARSGTEICVDYDSVVSS